MIARFLAEGVGFEPTKEREPPGGFQDRCLKPLGHPSKSLIYHDNPIGTAPNARLVTKMVTNRSIRDRAL